MKRRDFIKIASISILSIFIPKKGQGYRAKNRVKTYITNDNIPKKNIDYYKFI
ncbi:hypothetical protein JXR93_10350 [bacterium]|nr:hypothetical protein [bacterium]